MRSSDGPVVGEDALALPAPPRHVAQQSEPGPAESAGPPSDSPFANVPADAPLTWPAILFLVFIGVFGIVSIATSTVPLAATFAFVSAIVPTFFMLGLIIYRLRDPVVSKSFILAQAFILAVPGIFAIGSFELIFSGLSILLVLQGDLPRLVEAYADGIAEIPTTQDISSMTPEQREAYSKAVDDVWRSVVEQLSPWKPFLLAFIMAFFVAAFIEETAKYLTGRRYRQKLDDGIKSRGIIACTSAAALGLAGAEHVLYTGGYVVANGLIEGVLMGLLRAVVALPLHVGTGFYMGTRMARHAVLKEPDVGFAKTLLVPILFHGLMDFVAFIITWERRALPFLAYLGTPFDLCLIGVLIALCRRNYREVLQRESAVAEASVSFGAYGAAVPEFP